MKILEVKKLYKEYGNSVAVDGVNFCINEGEIFGLLGPNGAGKSTIISMITGLIKSSEGETIFEEKESKINKWKQNIGLVPQDFALYFDLSAEENIKYFCSLYGFRGEDLKKRVDNALEFVGLLDVRGKRVNQFSGGMKRRLNMACAIAHTPKLIIMDEPTVGIDPQSRNHILESVKKLRDEGATIIYTSHYMEEVDEICDKIAIMDHGKIIAEGNSEYLKSLVSDKNIYSITLKNKIEGIETALKAVTGIEKVIATENELKCYYLKESNVIEGLVAAISKKKGVVENIKNETPSLETVFLALTGKKLRD
ncbi:ABC transporter ATP-binding protein [Clostridium gasigenes]|uniref:ABC-2 type transport system ATP-binding protein n=1 Tax=Clostridium gasigenes TaxID=94869 RepID=A0A1H0LIM8_9CLOT|nr:ABC transporter ATP-binding protein [Clostridium gasigenes]MBB6622490.1 ABC transporter ATP-binding protein [Clostridium gasigenes]MBU3087258.1 ABC transporter ATP-binding protein [Clostridium gasigenes]SDO67780.1 ABC-2 type transport system ATP-binding protein [Clostridium gasigenes]